MNEAKFIAHKTWKNGCEREIKNKNLETATEIVINY